jgi:hypothetical protein
MQCASQCTTSNSTKIRHEQGGLPFANLWPVAWVTLAITSHSSEHWHHLRCERREDSAISRDRQTPRRRSPLWAAARIPFPCWKLVVSARLCWNSAGTLRTEGTEILAEHAARSGIFIDLGAAEGYYGVGTVSQALLQKAHCIETSEDGLKVITSSAAYNVVADHVTIFGATDALVHRQIPLAEISGVVVLIDIEGAESESLTDAVLDYLDEAVIIIETPWSVLHGDNALLDIFVARLNIDFRITQIRSDVGDPAGRPELEKLTDHERWRVCSESRGHLGEWRLLTPKAA